MALTCRADLEVLEYLRFLTEHADYCGLEGCSQCETVQKVCEAVKSLVFSSGVDIGNQVAGSDVRSDGRSPSEQRLKAGKAATRNVR